MKFLSAISVRRILRGGNSFPLYMNLLSRRGPEQDLFLAGL